MAKCQNPKCNNEITMQIRKGGITCSLDCDRALGIGKYAEQADAQWKDWKELLNEAKQKRKKT